MKTSSLGLLALTAACCVLALPVNAATDNPFAAPPLHGPGRGHGLEARPPRLADMDSNNDGKISLEEFLAPRLARLDKLIARLDKNGDGVISQEEIHPAPPVAAERPARPNRPNRPSRPVRPGLDRQAVLACVKSSNPDFDLPAAPDHEAIGARFDQADANGDGKLSLAELSAAVTARAETQFKRLDQDNDGYLTAADRKAGQAERAALAKAVQACVKAQK